MATEARISRAVDAEWEGAPCVRLGGEGRSTRASAAHVFVSRGDERLFRLELHAADEACAFEEACVWRDLVVVGFGHHVHLVSLSDRTATSVGLGAYFGHLYPTEGYLLIASGRQLFRIDPDRSVRWQSDSLGVDGVLVHDASPPIVRGEAELDPPGGWQPFTLFADSGRPVELGLRGISSSRRP